MDWIRDRALTLVLMAMFLLFLAGQVVTGFWEFNDTRTAHGREPIVMSEYFATGHPWEALFENWESEFLQMAVFILLTTVLVQKGSPESRRPHVKERDGVARRLPAATLLARIETRARAPRQRGLTSPAPTPGDDGGNQRTPVASNR